MYFGLTEAAKEIGICRAWLYRKYLPKYPPKNIGGCPKLTIGQVEKIKDEHGKSTASTARGKKNGK